MLKECLKTVPWGEYIKNITITFCDAINDASRGIITKDMQFILLTNYFG